MNTGLLGGGSTGHGAAVAELQVVVPVEAAAVVFGRESIEKVPEMEECLLHLAQHHSWHLADADEHPLLRQLRRVGMQ